MAAAKTTKGTRSKATTAVAETATTGTEFNYAAIQEEIEAELSRNLNEWLPRCIDEKGGFHQSFDSDWKRPKKDEPRFAVFQARMTWLAANGMAVEPRRRKEFQQFAQHGFQFLASKQWDAERGGFYDNVSKDGTPVLDGIGQIKSIYSNAFGVYALASMYRRTSDLFALDLAYEAFEWIDAYAHDDVNGGYFNVVTTDGKPAPVGFVEASDETKEPGIKTMNTHIHLLEAFTELLRATPHVVVQERVEELLAIVRDKIGTKDGSLSEKMTEDWQPISKTCSYGHDVETAFLLLDSAEALGRKNDPETLAFARLLVDHALEFGWNQEAGQLAHSGDLKGKILSGKTSWWMSAESLNAFLLMHELFGSETDKYWKAFVAQWGFIKAHHIDSEHGGWFDTIDEKGKALGTHKGGPWKEAYHETRAMAHVSQRLGRLADPASSLFSIGLLRSALI